MTGRRPTRPPGSRSSAGPSRTSCRARAGSARAGSRACGATSPATIPPAPPKATSVRSRGSSPFQIDTDRTALAMLAWAISTIPLTTRSSVSPSGSREAGQHARPGRLAVEVQAAAGELLAEHAAQQQRVRQRGLGAATAVADRDRGPSPPTAGPSSARRPGRSTRCCRRRRRPTRRRASARAPGAPTRPA